MSNTAPRTPACVAASAAADAVDVMHRRAAALRHLWRDTHAGMTPEERAEIMQPRFHALHAERMPAAHEKDTPAQRAFKTDLLPRAHALVERVASTQTGDEVIRIGASQGNRDGRAVSSEWNDVDAAVNESVVQIFSQVAQDDDLSPQQSPRMGLSAGSGFVVEFPGDTSGPWILTNAHVVVGGNAVWLEHPRRGAKRFPVRVWALSPERDVALLRYTDSALADDTRPRRPLPMGSSDDVKRGHNVVVVGHPLGFSNTVIVQGLVSSRQFLWGTSLIQTDTASNHGNSGGPLLSIDGKWLGILSLGIDDAQATNFARPQKTVWNTALELRNLVRQAVGFAADGRTENLDGAATLSTLVLQEPRVGASFAPLTSFLETAAAQSGRALPVQVGQGMLLGGVDPSSVFGQAGAQANDILVSFDGTPIDNYGQAQVGWDDRRVWLQELFERVPFGGDVPLTVLRGGERVELTATWTSAKRRAVGERLPFTDPLEYEILGGLVVQPLTLNLIKRLGARASHLFAFTGPYGEDHGALVVTDVLRGSVFGDIVDDTHDSLIERGDLITAVNGRPVDRLYVASRVVRNGSGGEKTGVADVVQEAILEQAGGRAAVDPVSLAEALADPGGVLNIATQRGIPLAVPLGALAGREPATRRLHRYAPTPLAEELVRRWNEQAGASPEMVYVPMFPGTNTTAAELVAGFTSVEAMRAIHAGAALASVTAPVEAEAPAVVGPALGAPLAQTVPPEAETRPTEPVNEDTAVPERRVYLRRKPTPLQTAPELLEPAAVPNTAPPPVPDPVAAVRRRVATAAHASVHPTAAYPSLSDGNVRPIPPGQCRRCGKKAPKASMVGRDASYCSAVCAIRAGEKGVYT